MNDATAKYMVYIFIDASNLWAAFKAKGRFIAFDKTIEYIKKKVGADGAKAFYYTAYPADGTRRYGLDGKHKFFTYLKKGLGFAVIKKELKRITIVSDNGEAIEEKGNMDVEITIDALHHFTKYTTAVFFYRRLRFSCAGNVFKKSRKKGIYFFFQE